MYLILKKPVNIFVDNQSAINLAKNPVHPQCTKHIYVKYNFIGSKVESGFTNLQYITNDENLLLYPCFCKIE